MTINNGLLNITTLEHTTYHYQKLSVLKYSEFHMCRFWNKLTITYRYSNIAYVCQHQKFLEYAKYIIYQFLNLLMIEHSNTRKYMSILANTNRYSKIYQYSKIYIVIRKHISILKNIYQYSKTYRYSKMYTDTRKYIFILEYIRYQHKKLLILKLWIHRYLNIPMIERNDTLIY